MKRPIAISLSPNTSISDGLIALRSLFLIWMYFSTTAVKSLEQWFRQFFGVSYAISFNSGRGALYAILKSLDIGKGDEVLIQAFTCVAVPDTIIATFATPVYVDITDSYTLDVIDLESKISPRTKAIIVQHTFGIAAPVKEIKAVAKKHKLFVIEDVAHTIGATDKAKKLGTFGDAAIFSFGRDKAFSSVFGGVAITDSEVLGKKIRQMHKQLSNPSVAWTIQQLLHPILFIYVILPTYNFFSLGKLLLVLFQKLNLLSFPVRKKEKYGELDRILVKKLPNHLANLALAQLRNMHLFNQKRRETVNTYIIKLGDKKLKNLADLPLLRFPYLVEKRDECVEQLKRRKIYLGTWYSSIIDPVGVDYKKVFYTRGSCPSAEHIAKRVINLPTYPFLTQQEIELVIKSVKQYVYH